MKEIKNLSKIRLFVGIVITAVGVVHCKCSRKFPKNLLN